MRSRAFWSAVLLTSGMLFAQQPMPMGKVNDSSKNYRSVDGTALSKHSSDEDLARALNESYANDPEFGNVQVAVKHHRVTLAGTVLTKDAKQRAEKTASNMAGVRDVRDRLKVGAENPRRPSSEVSTAH